MLRFVLPYLFSVCIAITMLYGCSTSPTSTGADAPLPFAEGTTWHYLVEEADTFWRDGEAILFSGERNLVDYTSEFVNNGKVLMQYNQWGAAANSSDDPNAALEKKYFIEYEISKGGIPLAVTEVLDMSMPQAQSPEPGTQGWMFAKTASTYNALSALEQLNYEVMTYIESWQLAYESLLSNAPPSISYGSVQNFSHQDADENVKISFSIDYQPGLAQKLGASTFEFPYSDVVIDHSSHAQQVHFNIVGRSDATGPNQVQVTFVQEVSNHKRVRSLRYTKM